MQSKFISEIIDNIFELNFDKMNKDKLLEECDSYDDIKDNIMKYHSYIMKLINENNKELYYEIVSDETKFMEFTESVVLSYLIENDIIDEEYIEEIMTLDFTKVAIFAAVILLRLFRIPERIASKIKNALFIMGKTISKMGKNSYFISLFSKSVPRECKEKHFHILKRLVPAFKKPFISSPKDISEKDIELMYNRVIKIDKSNIQLTKDFIVCSIMYMIKVTSVQLMLFYKCLYDNKKFMDLISIRKKPVESLLFINKLGEYSIFEKANSSCVKEYEDFKELYEATQKIIETFFNDDNETKSKLFRELDKSLQNASVYAQKLLDEGKRKMDNNKHTDTRDNKSDRNRRR